MQKARRAQVSAHMTQLPVGQWGRVCCLFCSVPLEKTRGWGMGLENMPRVSQKAISRQNWAMGVNICCRCLESWELSKAKQSL